MSAGSEKFAWKLFPGVPRVCSVCGRSLRVVDVGRHHSSIDKRGIASTFFVCRDHVHEGGYA